MLGVGVGWRGNQLVLRIVQGCADWRPISGGNVIDGCFGDRRWRSTPDP